MGGVTFCYKENAVEKGPLATVRGQLITVRSPLANTQKKLEK